MSCKRGGPLRFHAPGARPALDILIDRKLVLHRAGRDLIDIVAEPALEGGQLQRCVFALMPDEQLRAPAPLALQRRIADLERLCSGMRPVGEQLLGRRRSEEHTSELQSLMRISYAVFCLKKKKTHINNITNMIQRDANKQNKNYHTHD